MGRVRTVLFAALALTGCAVEGGASSVGPSVASPSASDLDPVSIVWLASREVEEDDIPIAVRLSLARGDGMVLWRGELAIDTARPGGGYAFLSGPRAGTFAFAPISSDGGADVRVVTAADGERAVARYLEPPIGGAVASDGGSIFVLVAGESAAVIERLTLDGERDEVAEVDVDVASLRGQSGPPLYVSADGHWLVVQSCSTTCEWWIVDPERGSVRTARFSGAGEIIGVSNDALLAVAPCDVGPCRHVLVDLATGVGREVDVGAHEARIAVGAAGETLIVSDNQGTGTERLQLSVLDPATGVERVLPLPTGNLPSLGVAREGQGDWTPPGWIVVAQPGTNLGEGGLGPALVRLADGHLVLLPPVAEG